MATKKKSAKKKTATKKSRAATKPKPNSKPKPKPAATKKRAATKPKPKRPSPAKKPAKKAKAAAPKSPAKKPAATPAKKKPPAPRRDATGHLDAKYASELRARSRDSETHDGEQNAFLHGARSGDDLAEELGEDAVHAMTSGEGEGEGTRDQVVTEEIGGPFVETTGSQEYAGGTDASNPAGAKREPFPKT